MQKFNPMQIAGKFLMAFATLVSALSLTSASAEAATGELGTGVPNFGFYSKSTFHNQDVIVVWSLRAPMDRGFPSGCSNIMLTTATMGEQGLKMAMATLMTAKLTNRQVRLYSHAPRDGGCGVDYIELF
jgi:hypothetical protein